MAHSEHHGGTIDYEHGLVRVSEEDARDEDARDEGAAAPPRWTGWLVTNPQLPEGTESPARVWCGGQAAACFDCQTNPPCGGTVKPLAVRPKHIAIHPDASTASASEISFGKRSLHRIAILDPVEPVLAALAAWRAAHADHSEVVYHVYRIERAPSRQAIEGKLIAIPVGLEPAG